MRATGLAVALFGLEGLTIISFAPAAKRMAEDTEKLGADGVGNIMVRLVVRNGKRGGSNRLRDGGEN